MIINQENFINWLDDLEKFWKVKDVTSILKLFDKNVEYYETPFDCLQNKNNQFNKIELAWHDIDTHKILKLYYKILGFRENVVIVNFILELENRTVDMVYEVELNENNKCIYFKQWYMSK